jgi:large subunit ribosomal protein L25
MTELDVKCMPKDLPEFIEVDLKDLVGGASIHVTQLAMPAGVKPVLHKGEDPVVAAIVVRGGGAAAEEMEAAAPVETQVITEKKPAEKAEKK